MYDQWINMHQMGLQNTLDAEEMNRKSGEKMNHFTQTCCLIFENYFLKQIINLPFWLKKGTQTF